MTPAPREIHTVTGHEIVQLSVPEFGQADAPAILLIHGWSQHHLCWSHQVAGSLAERFRLIAPDLRGHGGSDKPDDASAYNLSAPWAGDIAAIIRSLDLDKPVLVGWSMGGWVVQDYIRVHGDSAISGVVLVGTSLTTGKLAPREAVDQRGRDTAVRAKGMLSSDQAENLAATIAFVEACSARPLPPRDLALMTGYNMLVPPHVRAACRLRSEDYRDVMQQLTKPVMVIWGSEERLALPAMIDETLQCLTKAQAIKYDGCGHAPFWEDPDRFNADLEQFALGCQVPTDEMLTT